MKRSIRLLGLMVALLAIAAAPARADTELTGSTDGGAFFRIVVPDAWNGDVVIWNHGFSLTPIGPVADLGPLAQLQLGEGYAVAASSYQQIGWSLFKTKNDLQNMMGVFKANFGAPKHVIVHGASLGGIVTAEAIEEAHLGNVVGAYPICGALAGSRDWDGALDLRLVYDVICGDVPGAAIPGGATGLPAPGFPGFPFSNTDLGTAVNACMGLLNPATRTPEQSARLAQFLAVTQIPQSFILTDMGFALFGLSNLTFEDGKLDGQRGVGNIGVDYDDGGFIDTHIQRVTTNPGAHNRLERHFTPEGDVGAVKIVSIHTDGDGLVLVENESSYAKVVPPENLTTAIVDEAGNTHCGFNGAEVVAGWESLRSWLAGGPKPNAASIQAVCNVVAPLAGGPCRFDPSFVIPDIDGRIRPRPELHAHR